MMKVRLSLNFLMITQFVLILMMIIYPTQREIMNLTEFTDLMLAKVAKLYWLISLIYITSILMASFAALPKLCCFHLAFLKNMIYPICAQRKFSVMFSHWCSQLWMDITFLFFVMDKVIQERPTLWFVTSSRTLKMHLCMHAYTNTCVCVRILYMFI